MLSSIALPREPGGMRSESKAQRLEKMHGLPGGDEDGNPQREKQGEGLSQ